MRKIKIPELVYHSKERTLLIARQYEGTNFCDDHFNLYVHALRNGYIEELKKNVKSHKSNRIVSEKQRIIKLAKNFQGKNFASEYHSEYLHPIYHGYLNEIKDFKNYKPPIKLSQKRTLAIAKKYKGTTFSRDHRGEHGHAVRMGYLQKLNAIVKRHVMHSQKRTLAIAKKYSGTTFGKDFPKEYSHAFRMGYLQKLKAVVGPKFRIAVKKRFIKKKKSVLEIARKYRGTNFAVNHNPEYQHALVNGYLKELRKAVKN